MRGTTRYILLLPMLGLCCTALPQASQQPTISIEAEKSTVELGQPIQIHIRLKNTANREFTVFQSVGRARGEQYYSIPVTGPNGKPGARTEYGEAVQKYHQPVAGSKIMRTVAPGKDVDEYVNVSDIFNISEPGKYIVQVSRASPLNPTVTLKSNKLTINVNK